MLVTDLVVLKHQRERERERERVMKRKSANENQHELYVNLAFLRTIAAEKRLT